MKLEELAKDYYDVKKKNCAQAILLAANDYYKLNLSDDSDMLLAGFGGGMGCGRLCGCLAASISVLGKLFGKNQNFREICKEFVSVFEEKLGCNSTECSDLTAKYKNPETRCLPTVVIAAQALDNFIAEKQ